MQKNYLVHQLNVSLLATLGLFLSLLLLACGNSTTAAAKGADDPTVLTFAPRAFALNSRVLPMFNLHCDVCQAHVGVGDSAKITVQVIIRHYRANKMPTITYAPVASRSTLTVNEKLPVQQKASIPNDSIEFKVSVPRTSNLALNTGVGSFGVDGVAGQMSLVTRTGSIKTNNVLLKGRSSLASNVGSITFSGNVERNGTYSMETHVGAVKVALPAQASVQVSAQTSLGSVDSDFSSIQANGTSAQGAIGSGPYAHLSLATHIGSISLQEA